MESRNRRGNLVVVVVVVGVIILALAFFALNYTSILGTRKEAQTAADAAALYVVGELTSITVPSKMGPIGLVDLNPKDANNPFFKTNPNNEVPVIGFNTAVATLRLDTLIANDLENQDMLFLAERDRKELIEVGKKLQAQILARVAKGQPIYTQAIAIYEQNNRRLGGPGALDKEKFLINVGRLADAQGTTNCPIPTPADDAAKSQESSGFYKSGVDIPAVGKSFVFAPIGDEPRLVDAGKFIDIADPKYGEAVFNSLPCTVVKIDASNAVREFSDKKKDTGVKLNTIACAQVGSNRLKARSTVYTIGFAGSLPSKGLFESLTVDSLLRFDKWGDASLAQSGTWLKNQGDKEYPGGKGGGVPLQETNFVEGRGKIESPGTALAYGIYDWLRSLRLRPNRTAFVALIKGDDLRDNSEVREFKFPLESQDEEADSSEEGDADEATEVGDEDTFNQIDTEQQASETESESSTAVPIQGCVFRATEGGTDPRFEALRDGSPEGALAYFDSFNYRPLDEDICPDSSIAFTVDPITGEPKGQAGNSIIELCQLVEGTIATNRAGFISRLAGIEAVPQIQNARRVLFNEVNRGVNRVKTDVNQLANAEQGGNPETIAARKTDLRTSLEQLRNGLVNYKATQLVSNSPISTIRSGGSTQSPSEKVEEFLAIPFPIPADKAKEVAQKYVTTGNDNFEQLVLIERHRIQGISRRARRMRINGLGAMRRTVRLGRRLRRFSARGIRRLDARLEGGQAVTKKDSGGKPDTFKIPSFQRKTFEVKNPRNGKIVKRRGVEVSSRTDSGVPQPAFDLFPESPAFVVNIRRPGRSLLGPGHGGGGAAARIVHILPNNEPTMIRNGNAARPHFFSLDKPTREQENEYLKAVEGLTTDGWKDQVLVVPGKELGTGNKFFPQNKKIGQTFRRNWDTFGKQNKNGFGPNTVVGYGLSGRAFMRLYTKANVFGNDKTGKDARLEPFFLTLKQLRALIREAQLGNGLNEEDGNPEDFSPGFEQVFVLSCDGDASFDANAGNMVVTPVTKINKDDPRYPFGTNMLLPDQFLYFNGAGLKDGPDAPGSKSPGPLPQVVPLEIQRSVIARDQFADLSRGKSYKLQPFANWCKKDAPYELEIGSGSGECPYPAGEFRIGVPISVACCKLNPDKLTFNFRRRDFPSVVDLPDPFNEDVSPDNTLNMDDADDDVDFCPPLIRQGKTGKVLGFVN